MKDFTLAKYCQFLNALSESGYSFLTVRGFSVGSSQRTVVVRHDVDLRPKMALAMAKMENSLAIPTTYYFRARSGCFPDIIIKEIVRLGHEIGYHYEDLGDAQGDSEKAIASFKRNLINLRKLAEVKTICMHGSPLGKIDNRKLWASYDYRNFGIICEPYFDIDYSNVFYITDTGRKWNNEKTNIRDKVNSGSSIRIRNTNNLISLIKSGQMPEKMLINVHPQRWNNKFFPWLKEFICQNMKNKVKYFLVNK